MKIELGRIYVINEETHCNFQVGEKVEVVQMEVLGMEDTFLVKALRETGVGSMLGNNTQVVETYELSEIKEEN